MSARPKRKKNYSCIRCDEHVKVTDQAVKCALCDLWVHKLCEKMSDETFKVLDLQNDETGQCFWSCKSCKSYALKFDKRMRDVEKRVQKLEEKVPDIATDLEEVKEVVKSLKSKTEELEETSSQNETVNQSVITAAVFTEMRERQSRACNLVIHNLAEPDVSITENKERIQKDKDNVQELCNLIQAGVDVVESARFAKRLGPVSDDTAQPRPLLVGFKSVDVCNLLLDKAPDIADQEEPWSAINVNRDLTKTQRKEEKDLRDDAAKRNSELSEEDSLNWQWKVVGRRGERQLVKIKVNQEDSENREGSARGRGRGRGQAQGRRNQRR